MVKRAIQIGLSVFMAFILLLGGTAKEYLHMFADHEDTIHIHEDGYDGISFDNEHHHCSFLSFTLPPFLKDAASFDVPTAKCYTVVVQKDDVTHLIPRFVPASRLRGPPMLS